eukprot:388114_1
MSHGNSQYNHILYEGYLHKKGVYNKSWKRRYFVLYNDRTVDYFKDKSHSRQRNKAKGTIQLTQIERVEFVQHTNPSDKIHFLTKDPHNHTTIKHTSFDGVVSSFQTLPEYDLYETNTSLVSSPSIFPLISKKESNKSVLKCDKPYSFALISTSRIWILSATNTKELKTWINKLSELSLGQPICDAYFSKYKYYVLYTNRVLHGYKNDNKSKLEVNIDLNNMLYLKRMNNDHAIEIGLPNNGQNIILFFKNETETNLWYNSIISLFDIHNDSIIKYEYCSMINNLNIVHEYAFLCYRHVAIYTGFMVIFKNKSQCHSVKNNTLFFKKNAFRQYFENQQCILIKLNDNVSIRRASKSRGKYAFCVSQNKTHKKWYFCVKTRDILNKWLDCLGVKRKGSNSSLYDMDIKKTNVINVDNNIENEKPKKVKQISFGKQKSNMNVFVGVLSPIIDSKTIESM